MHQPDKHGSIEAVWMLEEILARKGALPGQKGGLFLWGMTGNYTNGETFVSELHDFWNDLLKHGVPDSLFSHEHIIVFVEKEQAEHAECWEIGLDEGENELVIKHHTLPFAWMQH